MTPTLNTYFCKHYWWRNLLYSTNFAYEVESDLGSYCLGQTWYLNNDMQFFLIAIFIIYPLWKMPKVGLPLAAGWIIASIGSQLGLTIREDWPASPSLG